MTNRGHIQAERVALRLAVGTRRSPSTRLHAGPRVRIRQTAEIVSQAHQLPMLMGERLDGPVRGAADGLPWGT
ncbi:histidine phosphatase family protein [Streptomyces sp. NPDC056269]|uniref:histidine phosphatase family protein n=1 Tax=Streptomyces sp. NPDC056269 TaxID=3345768 RepID=UPI0035DA7583